MMKQQKKRAKKTFQFWFNVLLGTNLMDDPEHRQEFLNALQVLKKKSKKEPV